jgi:hypothetical protein
MKSKACFFCGEEIAGKLSKERIFADSFLKYLDLKEQNVTSLLPHPTSVPYPLLCSKSSCGTSSSNSLLSILRDQVLRSPVETAANSEH